MNLHNFKFQPKPGVFFHMGQALTSHGPSLSGKLRAISDYQGSYRVEIKYLTKKQAQYGGLGTVHCLMEFLLLTTILLLLGINFLMAVIWIKKMKNLILSIIYMYMYIFLILHNWLIKVSHNVWFHIGPCNYILRYSMGNASAQ